MENHKWTVGALKELYPTPPLAQLGGKIPPITLGLNKNKGQEILLRLRTDDLQGWRGYEDVLDVLLHELTHNVHSEHDDKFHKLNRELQQEAKKIDWAKRSRGHRVGGDDQYEYTGSETVYVDEKAFEGGSFRLGGNSKAAKGVSAREMAARAALARITVMEQKLRAGGCGTHKEKEDGGEEGEEAAAAVGDADEHASTLAALQDVRVSQ